MIDFGHKKVGKFNFLTCAGFYARQKMEMRLFMWLDFYLHFWDCTKTRQRNEVLRDCFTASLLNGSLVFFFCQVKNHQRDLDGFIGQSDKLQRVGIYIFLQ